MWQWVLLLEMVVCSVGAMLGLLCDGDSLSGAVDMNWIGCGRYWEL